MGVKLPRTTTPNASRRRRRPCRICHRSSRVLPHPVVPKFHNITMHIEEPPWIAGVLTNIASLLEVFACTVETVPVVIRIRADNRVPPGFIPHLAPPVIKFPTYLDHGTAHHEGTRFAPNHFETDRGHRPGLAECRLLWWFRRLNLLKTEAKTQVMVSPANERILSGSRTRRPDATLPATTTKNSISALIAAKRVRY